MRISTTQFRRDMRGSFARISDGGHLEVTCHGETVAHVVNSDEWSGMRETLDILSNEDALRDLLRGMDDVRAGRVHDHESVKAELEGGVSGE